MAAITRLLEEIRGEKAPAVPYDPRRERIEQRRRTEAQTAQTQGRTASAVRQEPTVEAVQEEGQGA
jgi:hypothetical protein